MLKNVMLCGVGGQGILFAAKIIAAAAELSGYDVTTNELHGMAQRGGSGTASIRLCSVKARRTCCALWSPWKGFVARIG